MDHWRDDVVELARHLPDLAIAAALAWGIPAGAALAAAVFGDSGAAVALAAAILGGTLAAGVHLAKAGTRAAINTSPEPFSNWSASLAEDAMVPLGLWVAVAHPLVFFVLLFVFLAAAVLLLWVIWRGLRRVFGGAA